MIFQQAAYGQYGQNAYQMQGGGTQQGGQPQQAYGNPTWMPQGGQHGGAGRMQQQQPNGYDNPLENSFQGMNLGGVNVRIFEFYDLKIINLALCEQFDLKISEVKIYAPSSLQKSTKGFTRRRIKT